MGAPGRTLTVYLAADTRQATTSLNGFGASLATFAKGAAIAGLAAAGYALGRFALDSVQAASDLEQSMGAVESVFKRNADTVERWAASAADSLGLSQAAYGQMAAVIGAQLQGLGLSLDGATTRTRQLMRMGADLAATFGGTTQQAVEALGSALRGEYDPIEQYGISIRQADIDARLAAKGLGDLEGKAKKVAQAQAVLTEITKGAADAHGQFAREADTTAGAQQRIAAKWENIQAKIGQAFAPAVIAGLKTANQALDDFGKWWDANGDDVASTVSDLATALGKAGLNAKDLGRYLSSAKDAITTITPAVDALGRAWSWVNDPLSTGNSLLDGIRSTLRSLVNPIGTAIDNLSALGRRFGLVKDDVYYAGGEVQEFGGKVMDAQADVIAAARGMYGPGAAIGRNVVLGMQAGFNAQWGVFMAGVQARISAFVSSVKGQLKIWSPSRVFIDIGGDIVKGLEIGLGGMKDLTDSVQRKLSDAVDALEQRVNDRLERLKSRLADAKQALKDYADTLAQAITGDVSLKAAWDAQGQDTGQTWLQAFTDQITSATAFAQALGGLRDSGASQALIDQVAAMGPTAGTELAGQLVQQGLVPGINEQLATVTELGNTMGTSISGTFYQAGVDSAREQLAGMAEWIDKNAQALVRLGRRMGVEIAKGIRRQLAAELGGTAGGSSTTTTTGTRAAAHGATAPTVVIQTGVGDPVAIAREIERVLGTRRTLLGVA